MHVMNSSKSENNSSTIHRVARVKMAKGESLQSLWGLCLRQSTQKIIYHGIFYSSMIIPFMFWSRRILDFNANLLKVDQTQWWYQFDAKCFIQYLNHEVDIRYHQIKTTAFLILYNNQKAINPGMGEVSRYTLKNVCQWETKIGQKRRKIEWYKNKHKTVHVVIMLLRSL